MCYARRKARVQNVAIASSTSASCCYGDASSVCSSYSRFSFLSLLTLLLLLLLLLLFLFHILLILQFLILSSLSLASRTAILLSDAYRPPFLFVSFSLCLSLLLTLLWLAGKMRLLSRQRSCICRVAASPVCLLRTILMIQEPKDMVVDGMLYSRTKASGIHPHPLAEQTYNKESRQWCRISEQATCSESSKFYFNFVFLFLFSADKTKLNPQSNAIF